VSRPRIGITSSIPRAADPQTFEGLRAYVRAVERAGGEPVVLYHDDRDELATLAGLLVSGGADVDPGRYGEFDRYPERAYEHESERDAFEFAALAHARVRAVPTLCICRGMQAANVVFGGTLYQDLASDCGPEFAVHSQAVGAVDSYAIVEEHVVALASDSRLAAIVGSRRLATNSVHHQAVREVAPAFRVVGRAGDGTIEALEATFAHPFFLCVQWHPERSIDDDAASLALFQSFVRAAIGDSLGVV